MAGWMGLFERIEGCEACGLCRSRRHAVPGEGNPRARLMLVGEGPGADEDAQGRPFVGASGALLTALLQAVGIERREVYIANVVKCRPPENRTPTEEEARACAVHLTRQFELVQPAFVVALGATAAKYVIGPDVRIRRDHGQWREVDGRWMMPTFHPSALLRDPSQKRLAYADFVSVMDRLKGQET